MARPRSSTCATFRARVASRCSRLSGTATRWSSAVAACSAPHEWLRWRAIRRSGAATLVETSLGKAPAADFNGNGNVGDTLLVVVAKTSSGWALFADTDGSGTLAGQRPIHDFAIAREFFGWHQTRRAHRSIWR